MVIINAQVVEEMEHPQHLALCLDRQGKPPEEIAGMLGLRIAAVKKIIGDKKLRKIFSDAMATPAPR